LRHDAARLSTTAPPGRFFAGATATTALKGVLVGQRGGQGVPETNSMAFGLSRAFWASGFTLSIGLICALDAGRALERPPALVALAATLCTQGQLNSDFRGGFLPLMGFGRNVQSMRTLRSAGRSLMIAAEQCRDGQPSERARLIMWHIVRRGEGLYYLTATNGQLMIAVEGIAANTANYLPASTNDPDILVDFANEKAFWLARFGDAGR
jgi:hypothetical protein